MSCAARQWPTHRDLSKGMLVWMCVGVFKQVPNCWMWTQRTCTDFPGSMDVRGAEPRSKHSPSIISVVSGPNRPVTGTGGSISEPEMGGSEWFCLFFADLLEQNRRGLVCTLWQFSSLSAIGGSRSFVFNITIFIFFDLLRFRFNLLIKTNKI